MNYSNHIKKYSFFKNHRMNTVTNNLITTSNDSNNNNNHNNTTTNNNHNNDDDDCSNNNSRNIIYSNAIPKEFKIISMLSDENEEIAIITCDIIPKKYEFYQE